MPVCPSSGRGVTVHHDILNVHDALRLVPGDQGVDWVLGRRTGLMPEGFQVRACEKRGMKGTGGSGNPVGLSAVGGRGGLVGVPWWRM